MTHRIFKLYRITGHWPLRRKKLVCTFLNSREAQETFRKVREDGGGWKLTPRTVSQSLPDARVFFTPKVWL